MLVRKCANVIYDKKSCAMTHNEVVVKSYKNRDTGEIKFSILTHGQFNSHLFIRTQLRALN